MVAVLEGLITPEILPFQYDLHAKNLFILSGGAPTPASASPPRNKLRARSPLMFPV